VLVERVGCFELVLFPAEITAITPVLVV